MTTNVVQNLSVTLNNALAALVAFIPNLVSGIVILLIGIIVASILKTVVLRVLGFIQLEKLLKRYGVPESAESSWSHIIAEIVRWFVIILFLIPVSDIWGLGRFSEVLNNLLLYLPNVLVAVLMILVGFAIARLVYNVLLASVRGVHKETAKTAATIGKWAVMVFVFLIVLNQLGIASDLIRILFSGFVAMLAIAGGLAFGLGGQDAAKDILQKTRKQL